ncbi:hypothetical protein BLNAU_20310 [Blattamonas nauphoetae]|uniref:Uncharacterized protein n=1 Tax=Blattamonas nauphoetae TaxID=2049346 RepID=A0ABQ9WZ48_9EUKA|nr:hypothetical protein BLNAU_20310 [Blattamonas nauphoetae]
MAQYSSLWKRKQIVALLRNQSFNVTFASTLTLHTITNITNLNKDNNQPHAAPFISTGSTLLVVPLRMEQHVAQLVAADPQRTHTSKRKRVETDAASITQMSIIGNSQGRMDIAGNEGAK